MEQPNLCRWLFLFKKIYFNEYKLLFTTTKLLSFLIYKPKQLSFLIFNVLPRNFCKNLLIPRYNQLFLKKIDYKYFLKKKTIIKKVILTF